MNISWINVSLNDIQNRDVATLLPRNCGHHTIFWLKKSAHHIQHSCLPNCLCLFDVVPSEWCIRGHEEMAPRSWYQRGNNADKIVVHISRVSKSGGTR